MEKAKPLNSKQVSFFDYIKYQYGPENPTSGFTHGEFGKLYFMPGGLCYLPRLPQQRFTQKAAQNISRVCKSGHHKGEFIEENKRNSI